MYEDLLRKSKSRWLYSIFSCRWYLLSLWGILLKNENTLFKNRTLSFSKSIFECQPADFSLSCLKPNFWLTVLYLILITPPNSVLSDAHGQDRHSSRKAVQIYTDDDPRLNQGKKQKKKIRVSYGKHRTSFKKLCTALSADGRSEWLKYTLELNSQKDPECNACRPLLKTFGMACKIKSEKRKVRKTKHKHEHDGAENEEEEHEEDIQKKIYKQRDPSTQVLQLTSTLFTKLAEEEKYLDQTILVINRLLDILRTPADKTKAELDYYSTLSQYMVAPFSSYLKEQELQKHKLREHENRGFHQAELDNLFNF